MVIVIHIHSVLEERVGPKVDFIQREKADKNLWEVARYGEKEVEGPPATIAKQYLARDLAWRKNAR